MKTYAMIGAAGFVAPRHMQAIRETGGELVAAVDPHDSVGILDSYFPNCHFFTEFERFGRHINKIGGVDYVVVCSPNYLHDFHVISALMAGCNVICEKPLVTSSRNLDVIRAAERKSGKKVNAILQLRLHPEIEKFESCTTRLGDKVDICYITPRGRWYEHSWKGDDAKSGGIATNIGIHLFDLMVYLYGGMDWFSVEFIGKYSVEGLLSLKRAHVNWELSINQFEKPTRTLTINDDVQINLSNGFSELHTKSYQMILEGKGFGIESARESIRICEKIRRYTRRST